MSHPGKAMATDVEPVEQSRLFVREPSWRVGLKQGSERTFCHAMAPGEEHYHRLADGELYLVRGDERICLPCAGRLGLLRTEARRLGVAIVALDVSAGDEAAGYELSGREPQPS